MAELKGEDKLWHYKSPQAVAAKGTGHHAYFGQDPKESFLNAEK